MKKLIWAALALIILIIGTCQAVTITRGEGNSLVVTGLSNGANVVVFLDGTMSSNGDGTYYATCPDFIMPVGLRNGKIAIKTYNTGVDQFIVSKDGQTASYTTADHKIDIARNLDPGTYTFTMQGTTTFPSYRVTIEVKGKKYGPDNIILDFNNIDAEGSALVKITTNSVRRFQGMFYFPIESKSLPIPEQVIMPRPTPTPKPMKSPGQIWAERNCWWYRSS